ncbi:MAG: ankyrin repeat domain-containing protein [Chloroflexota bacterium]
MNTIPNTISQELIDEFVNISHGYLGEDGFTQIKEMVEQHPDLVYAVHSDGDETGIGAAAHMGERQIVQYLLDKGATLDISIAAMMGWRDKLANFLKQAPALATAKGVHGIALIYFAALSGDVKMAEMIWVQFLTFAKKVKARQK